MRTRQGGRRGGKGGGAAYAAIDLGTNNCRLLIATPRGAGFRVVDAYSQIVRLGQGVGRTGALSDGAMDRTIEALKICAEKMEARHVRSARNVATQACRAASNGTAFLERIRQETGLHFDVITPEEEAALSVKGCRDLVGDDADAVMVFDIGGGSTEMSWVRVRRGADRITLDTAGWLSIPMGVVSLAEAHGGRDMTRAEFDAMTATVVAALAETPIPDDIAAAFREGRGHLIGTSGTVTSLAGVWLGLERYSRRHVDGAWLSRADTEAVTERLREMGFERRAEQPCIGSERADLVVPGCAILAGILDVWPAERIRVGDRGLREGLLLDLMAAGRGSRGGN
jgi:exopolyphosphatase/guanosine-5'-triphosphate,3'-diphosphate pyrophosphatase